MSNLKCAQHHLDGQPEPLADTIWSGTALCWECLDRAAGVIEALAARIGENLQRAQGETFADEVDQWLQQGSNGA